MEELPQETQDYLRDHYIYDDFMNAFKFEVPIRTTPKILVNHNYKYVNI